MGGGTMSDVRHVEDYGLLLGRKEAAQTEATQTEATPTSCFLPVDEHNLPPQEKSVLVRYRKDIDADTYGRVFSAVPVYSRSPYTRGAVSMFRGFVVARLVTGGVACDQLMDGDVADTIDGWMPMPS